MYVLMRSIKICECVRYECSSAGNEHHSAFRLKTKAEKTEKLKINRTGKFDLSANFRFFEEILLVF